MEVVGIDLPVLINPMEKEEKELFLGRNSNFKVMKHDQVMNEWKDNYYVYVSDHCEEWLDYIENIPFRKKSTIIHVLMNKSALNKPISKLINTTIILPTVYGPWQPENSVFYKCLNQNQFPFDQYEVEDRSDAIYSSDAATAILEISKLEHGVYQVQTDMKDHWNLLLKELGYEIILDSEKSGYPFFSQTDVKKYKANTKISPEVGIEMVKRHIRNREIMGY